MDVPRISVDEAKALLDSGQAAFIDTRSDHAWDGSDLQIPGAIRVPADQVQSYIDEIPAGKTLITYCT